MDSSPAGLLARGSDVFGPAFPERIQWTIGSKLTAYSCGGSRGFRPKAVTAFPLGSVSEPATTRTIGRIALCGKPNSGWLYPLRDLVCGAFTRRLPCYRCPVTDTTSQTLERPAARPGRRIPAIDVARGVALIAMAIYHFTWDLDFFGFTEPGLTTVGGWKFFARSIASSFLFLVGISLYLAHRDGIHWPSFWGRWAMVAGAALLVTLATYAATPQAFVYFGILHQIALASLLGLAFLRLPAPLILIVAAGTIALPFFYASDLFNHPSLWWVGLSTARARSSDYVPLFPWFGAVLIGIAAAKLADAFGLFARLRTLGLARWGRPLDFLGRHSLAFYLIHQPVLIGLVWSASQIAPPQPLSQDQRFIAACQRTCGEARSADFCSAYCVCMQDEISPGELADLEAGRDQTEAQKNALQESTMFCTLRTEDALPGESAR